MAIAAQEPPEETVYPSIQGVITVRRSTATVLALFFALNTSPAVGRTNTSGHPTAKVAAAHHNRSHQNRWRDPCANRLCTRYREGRRSSCWRTRSVSRQSQCYVVQAALHFHISVSEALYRARRESNFNPKVQNSSDHDGLFQMTWILFHKTPYGRRYGDRRTSAKWAALAYGWIVAHGGSCNWNPPSYCA